VSESPVVVSVAESPESEVDCVDGRDEDGDGLIDCEDGDCAQQCVETDCTDALDDDADGRIDCSDDDCWATQYCITPTGVPIGTRVSSRVMGGHGGMEKRTRFASELGSFSISRSRDFLGRATSVWGTAQVLAPSATISTVCTWTVASADWGSDYGMHNSGDSFRKNTEEWLIRDGFEVDEDCPLHGAFFLPELQMTAPLAKSLSGAVWYYGAGVDYSYHHEDYNVHYRGDRTSWTWTLSPFYTGDTYTMVTE